MAERRENSKKTLKIVNEIKTLEWQDNDKMTNFIRPRTLYGDKFIEYLNQNPNHRLQNGHSSRKWTIGNYYGTATQRKDTDGQEES